MRYLFIVLCVSSVILVGCLEKQENHWMVDIRVSNHSENLLRSVVLLSGSSKTDFGSFSPNVGEKVVFGQRLAATTRIGVEWLEQGLARKAEVKIAPREMPFKGLWMEYMGEGQWRISTTDQVLQENDRH